MSPFTCNHWGQVADGDFLGVYAFGGRGHRHGKGNRDGKPCKPKVTPEKAMGVDWMTYSELTQAIPPAYTEFIGRRIVEMTEDVV
jgi:DNA (cytosine-5)-methyltransferase 1